MQGGHEKSFPERNLFDVDKILRDFDFLEDA